ncbi:hypothetical protein BC827DRAFT_150019 [Russula dissimulans]|nr:hypothetical protein BC827DRAFT_150019 [Russula dissimulans]
MGNCNTSKVVDGKGAKSTNQTKLKKSRSPPRSESWVIEQDGFSLPSTASDVAIASVRSKPGTALVDIRAASWSRVLQNDVLDKKVPLPLEHYKDTQAISTLSAAAIVQGDASHTHLELEEQATVGPWESASQIAQSTLHPQEQRPAYSKYFSLPRGSESRVIQPIMHLSNNSLSQPAGVNSGRSNGGGDAAIDERLFYKEAGAGHEGEDLLPTSPLANILPVRKTSPLPEEGISVLQTSSLDSVDRALLLDIPVVTRSRPRIRRRTMRWHKFNTTPENMVFHQYGLDPPEDHFQVLRPPLHDHGDREPPDPGNYLGDSADLGNMQDNTLSFRGGGYAEGLEGCSEDQTGCSEHYPAIISDSPVFASQVGPTPLNGSYDCQDGAMFLIGEDPRYERVLETEEDCTYFNSDPISFADWRALPEGDTDRKASIRLWDDKAWPRGDALQEGCSHLTTVQKVEQDVARKLKDHWFPHKF